MKYLISFNEIMDKLRAIRTFIKVVELNSFAQTANALGLSTAGVTRDIAQLEAQLGTRLLQRHSRRLTLTETGHIYFERCKQIVADMDEADALVSAANLEPSGVLRINAPVSFGMLHLASLWPEFRKLYPKVELDITLNDRMVDLIEENVDMAIRVAKLASSNLIAKQISHTRLVVCAAPSYLARFGTPQSPFELKNHHGIAYAYWSGKEEWEFHSEQGEHISVSVPCVFRANNGTVIHAACLAGEGIAVLPSFIVGPDIAAQQLIPLLCNWITETLGIHVVYPSRKHLSAKVRAMRDFLVQAFPTPPSWEAWL